MSAIGNDGCFKERPLSRSDILFVVSRRLRR
jgi:hypothetical protein